MNAKKQLKIAYGLAIYFFIVGVVCYAAGGVTTPEYPIRIMFNNLGGNVLFTHHMHYADTGYGVSCGDCHHTLSEDEYEDAQSCSECHELDAGDEEVPKRADAFHQQCIGCHEDFEAGPVECASCHFLL